MATFGISAFVAHQDIQPTKAWQDEIENALTTMDAFVALLTEGFHESEWTDQEVGFALVRGIPVVSVRLGRDPYGFIGKFQALAASWETAPIELAKLFVNNSKLIDSYIQRMEICGSFIDGIDLAKMLPHIKNLTIAQADKMVAAYNHNSQLHKCVAFNRQIMHGLSSGFAPYLSHVTGQKYISNKSGDIERKS